MVKADMTRDYYADLELQPSADVNEIKKQFKKLALKYHPDRNIGRESEVNAKFQNIQSAHEVLIDGAERARYDAGRQKSRAYGSGFGSGMNAQRGNPYANAGSQWAPPPKRSTNARPTPPPPSAGAAKFKNFETPGAGPYRTAQEGAESRRSTYQAWENMRGKQDPGKSAYGARTEAGQGKHRAAPTAQKDSTWQHSRDDSGMKHTAPPKARSRFDEPSPGVQRSQSTKRTGFMPSDPAGDEPPAGTTSAYFTTRNRRSQFPEHQDAPPPPPPPPRAQPPSDPLRQFRESAGIPHEPRLSTPYATHGGEKTNPFESANINRSRSTKERSGTSAQQETFSPTSDRHRSASPPRSNRARTKSAANEVPRTDSDPSFGSQQSRFKQAAYKARFTTPGDESTSSEDEMARKTSTRPESRAYAIPRSRKPTATNSASTETGQNHPSTPTTNKQPSIFSIPTTNGTAERPPMKSFASTSTDSINTKFTPEDWHGKFTGGDYFTNEQKAANMPARSASRSRGRSPTKPRQPSRPEVSTQVPIPDLEPQTPTRSPGGTRFSAEEWASTFKPQTFAPPPIPSPSIRSAHTRRSSRTQKASNVRPTMGSAAVVEDESDSSGMDGKPLFMGRKPTTANVDPGSSGASSQSATVAASPNAMDIDTEEITLKLPTESSKDNQARNVPLEPSRADWRGINGSSTATVQDPNGPQPPPRDNASTGKRRVGESSGSDGFGAISLEDLKNAEPLRPESKGLNGFDDLASNLPFPSQASSRIPIARSYETGDLDLPKPPKAPLLPPRATKESWAAYLPAFKTYMVDWDIFNCRMIAHFQARRNQVQQIQSLYNDWLGQKSDEEVLQYIEGLKEDKKIREWWTLAAEGHEESMKNFMVMRLRMKDLMGQTA